MSPDQAESLRQQARSNKRPSVDIKGEKIAWRIAVTSGKGGVGKSNVSLNLAIAFAKLGKRVLLVDADTNLANIDILLGIKIKHTLPEMIFGKIFLSEVLVNGPEGIKILPGSNGVIEVLEHDEEVRRKIFDIFNELERQFDIIVVDTGAGLSENVVQFVIGADDVVLVTNSEPTSITDAYAMIKIAVARNPALRMHIMINLAAKQSDAIETFEKLHLVVKNFLNVDTHMLGFLPIDPSVPAAVARREPFISLFPRSAVSIAMIMIARKLLKLPVSSNEKMNFLQKILRSKEKV
ncbi:MAG: MinD/ParA family protein [Candidatus Electryonea clarkiae]|nr:MinD/ParA family protein [Candidatus Electryonea clarkiae]MDP8288059.1 MinD/ParA family protein [Candidatus Electryonea clarkiae]